MAGQKLIGRRWNGLGRIGTWLNRPLASFHLVVTIATLLTVFGLVMVLSASSVESYVGGSSPYALFTQQLMYALLGVVLFYLALRVPIRVLRKLAFPAYAVTLVALMLVLIPGVGVVSQGARRWFMLGPISVQPSEVAKVTLALWGAHLLASRIATRSSNVWRMIVPLFPLGILACTLVVLQPNLSTTIALGIILIALFWFGGLAGRIFAGISIGALALAVVLTVSAGYRSDRMRAFLNPGEDPQGIGYQSRQALYSLADGGMFGRGLGQSRAKWSYLPNSHNDFIFAIIGEETGFLGCAAVIGLFALFAYTGMRIATRSVDPFLRLLVATATTWIVAQALINIGYVVRILPVTGLQLPLVSAGGSSLAITLLMFGIIASAARHEPEAIAALLAGHDGRFSRMLRLPMPEAYAPGRAKVARARAERRTPVRYPARGELDDRRRAVRVREPVGGRAAAPRTGKQRAGAVRTGTSRATASGAMPRRART